MPSGFFIITSQLASTPTTITSSHVAAILMMLIDGIG
jgi:hypothetical protein